MQIYYPIAISVPPNKTTVLFFDSSQQKQLWVQALQKVMGYSNVFDFYSFEQTLGKGQFGLVKMATQIKTGQKVAIKQVKKKNMTHIEVFQQRREIEVLKMC
jgi:serine/threonine protein kinase